MSLWLLVTPEKWKQPLFLLAPDFCNLLCDFPKDTSKASSTVPLLKQDEILHLGMQLISFQNYDKIWQIRDKKFMITIRDKIYDHYSLQKMMVASEQNCIIHK